MDLPQRCQSVAVDSKQWGTTLFLAFLAKITMLPIFVFNRLNCQTHPCMHFTRIHHPHPITLIRVQMKHLPVPAARYFGACVSVEIPEPSLCRTTSFSKLKQGDKDIYLFGGKSSEYSCRLCFVIWAHFLSLSVHTYTSIYKRFFLFYSQHFVHLRHQWGLLFWWFVGVPRKRKCLTLGTPGRRGHRALP